MCGRNRGVTCDPVVYLVLAVVVGSTIGDQNTPTSVTRLQINDILRMAFGTDHTQFNDQQRPSRQIKAIDEIIAEADSSLTSTAEPRVLPHKNAILFEGDIVMDVQRFTALQNEISLDLFEEELRKRIADRNLPYSVQHLIQSSVRKKRATKKNVDTHWPQAVVPIRIAGGGFSSRDRRRITQAMNDISEATCICFRIVSPAGARNQEPHVRIVNGNGCSSYVGKSSRKQEGTFSQDLTLHPVCRTPTVVTHELLHTIGLYHEQSRPDRDKFIRINLDNVLTGKTGNFNRFGSRTINTRGLQYDFLSIMHYSSRAFNRNGRRTMVPIGNADRRRYQDRMGRSQTMSRSDIQGLNKMYGCTSGPQTFPTCSEYPYKFPNV